MLKEKETLNLTTRAADRVRLAVLLLVGGLMASLTATSAFLLHSLTCMSNHQMYVSDYIIDYLIIF